MNDNPLRLKLHSILVDKFPPPFKIYFRPVQNILLEYPCIVYDFKKIGAKYANNTVYNTGMTFTVTHMSLVPGDDDFIKLLHISRSKFIRSYISDNIVHVIYEININNT